jgi:5-methylcytosine-specific restriction endonuclease McrA
MSAYKDLSLEDRNLRGAATFLMASATKPCKNRPLKTETPAAFAPLRGTGSEIVLELVTADGTRHDELLSSHTEGFWLAPQAKINASGTFSTCQNSVDPIRSCQERRTVGKRKQVSTKTRFEVFKRDKFTCQYCGEAAPKVLLHVDHIEPVAGGGGNDILNLITACQDCNAGKGARRLDDSTEVQKQHAQLAELQARREQIEMMVQWRSQVQAEKHDLVDIVIAAIEKHDDEYKVFAEGRACVKRWVKRYPLDILLEAVDESFETYLSVADAAAVDRTWHKAFNKIPAVANVLKQKKSKPYITDLIYIQGIARRRLDCKWINCIADLEAAHIAGVSIDALTTFTKQVNDYDHFFAELRRVSGRSSQSGNGSAGA